MTVFLAAALLFIVEPMFARMVLPRLGGAPAVWNTAMVFYQAALLAGYGGAHLIATRLRPRQQVIFQLGLVAAALLVLPLSIRAGWTPPVGRNPIPWLLLVMTVTVGLPFFALATLSPLLQRWFAACGARNPYWLYAASNAGSLVGLLAYPVVLEPLLGLTGQVWWWRAGYILLVALVAICGGILWWRGQGTSVELPTAPIAWSRRLRWVALAFAPSSLMLSVTTYLATEVAAVPLLWVVPLAIYLVTFILVFAQRQWIKQAWTTAAWPWVVLPLTVLYGMRVSHSVGWVGVWNLLALFIGAMVCHGQLAADRPPPERLTEFYWWVSVGGVLGGVFNALLAPVLFRWVAEYPISVVFICLMAARLDRPSWSDFAWPIGLGIAGWELGEWVRHWPTEVAWCAMLFKLAVPAAVALLLRQRPLRFALAVVALFAAAMWLPGERLRMLALERSFFGVHRVRTDVDNQFHRLEHGTTLHGIQSVVADHKFEPLSYYSRSGPVGQLFSAGRQMHKPMLNVGVVGLGTGAVAAYALPGETWTFFEIDPVVERIARAPQLFTYLSDCRGTVNVTLGDARLSLQGWPERFDVLVLDAYSSDAIPLHLLTREAVRLYLDRLADDGWLIFHFSNRHLNLEPVLAALASDAGLTCRVQLQKSAGSENLPRGALGSSWAVMSRTEQSLGPLLIDERWQIPDQNRNNPVWTDDYASILSVWR